MNCRGQKFISFFFTVFVFLFLAFGAQGAKLENTADLEAFFDGIFAIQMDQYRVPGASVALVKQGEIIFSKGYGYADLKTKQPFDPETTLHRPGSNSKILVWTAVLQLEEQGLLDLYSDINTYLDFNIPAKLANGQEAPPITLHHLLTHTAGLEEVLSQVFVTEPEELKPLGEYLPESLPKRVFPPGTIMAYSNYGASLAAYIVELVSGQPFAAYVKENIFEPLQMVDSTFSQPLPTELSPAMSKGYLFQNGRYQPGRFELVQSSPAGALTSSTRDMARLMIAHLQLGAFGEERILQEKTASLMQEQHFSSHPQIPGMAYGFIEDEVNGYRILSHGGDTGLFHTGLYLLPQQQVGLYVAYNSAGAAPARGFVFQQFMNRYFPPEDEPKLVPKPILPGNKKNYLGTFQSTRSNYTKWEAVIPLLDNVQTGIDEDGYLTLSKGGNLVRFGVIGTGLFQSLPPDDWKIAAAYENGRLMKIHLPGPVTLVRIPWYRTPVFVSLVLFLSSLLMLLALLGWTRRLFKKKGQGRPFAVPKIFASLFIIGFFTMITLFLRSVLDLHPGLGLPRVLVEPPSTLNPVFHLAKALLGLALIVSLTAVYSWIKKRGSLWQRIYYSLLTLSMGSIVWILWQFNFL
ncbi:MAG: serine hydrolase [Firmicutes bacterium]|nr:serine hydrolase [Bacillota bacterium]